MSVCLNWVFEPRMVLSNGDIFWVTSYIRENKKIIFTSKQIQVKTDITTKYQVVWIGYLNPEFCDQNAKLLNKIILYLFV